MENNEYKQAKKMLQEQFIRHLKSYIGVPFLHAGRNIYGVDCIGLVIAAGKDSGLLGDYDNTSYSTVVNPALFKREIEHFCSLLPRQAMDKGDLLFFSMRGTAHTTTHVGIYLGGGEFIHADQAIGKVVIQRLYGTWEKRLISVYRWEQWLH